MRFFLYSLLAFSCFAADSTVTSRPPVLAFEARNQQFLSHGPGYSLSVTSRAAVLRLAGHAVRISVSGGSPTSSLEPLDRMPGKANYLLGRDVRASYDLYGRIRWRRVYPGIDLVFRGNQEHLEYDFEIGAGKDPGKIKLHFDGIEDLRVDSTGDLVLRAGTLQIHQPKPVAYQMIAGQKVLVDAAYRIDASNHIRFRTGAYDRERPLVIDPQIVFDKSFGGSGFTSATGLARDTGGNLYVAGNTSSTDFATVNPLQGHLGGGPLLVTADAGQTFSFPSLQGATSVSAIASAPSSPLTVYAATSLGIFHSADGGATWAPTAGVGLPATGLAVDASSATTLYAATQQGIFVSTDGAATWQASTNGLSGTRILTIVAHPSQTGTVFASVQSPSALLRSTDFGQTWTQLPFAPNQLTSAVNAIVIGSNGAIIVATNQGLLISTDGGNTWTAEAGLPVQNNQTLAISPDNPSTVYLVDSSSRVQKSTDGGQTFSTVFSSNHLTQLSRVAIDPRNPNTVYVTDYDLLFRSTDAGQTWSTLSLPNSITPQTIFISPADSRVFLGIYSPTNLFVTKWSANASQVLYSTYLGGSGRDGASGIVVDASGSAYITGVTSSSDFPTTTGAFQTKLSSPQDVFVAKLSPDGSRLIYSTLLGSQSAASTSIALDNSGSAVITGFTPGNFPVTSGSQTVPATGCYMNPSPNILTSGAAFVTRIAANGASLISSMLLSGSCATYSRGVALDAGGNAWVAGWTLSPDFPVTSDALQPQFGGGVYDGFLARINPSGGLDYASYLGGQGYDVLNAIALDQSGNIYVTGESGGLSQPASPGAFQPQASASCPEFFIGPSEYVPQGNALVVKLDPKAHSIQRLTYLGAPLCLAGSAIAVDSTGEPWISAPYTSGGSPQTASPLSIGVGQGFISKFSADFTQLLFSTYFDSVAGLVLDSSGAAYVTGTAPFNDLSGAQPAYIAKIDSTPPPVSLDSVMSVVPSVSAFCIVSSCPTHPASFQGIAPGELIQILGKKMGPANATPGVINSGILATNVSGVQVTFDGVAVPLLSVSAQEIDLVAPFELTNAFTTVQVVYNGVKSNPVQVAVTSTVLQILGVFNQDFSPNSAANPAPAGSQMILYFAGAGQTNPPSQDGQVNIAPLAAPAMPIQIQWLANDPNNPTILPIAFSGAAPGLAAGIFQVNFIAPSASLMNVYLLMGNANAPFNVWTH